MEREYFLDNIGLALTVNIILIYMSGKLTMIETALNERHRTRLEKLTEEEKILSLNESPERFIMSVKILNSITKIIYGMMIFFFSMKIYSEEEFFISFTITIIIASILILILGVAFPQRLGKQSPEKILLDNYSTIKIISIMMAPIEAIITNVARILIMVFGNNEEEEGIVTEEEVKDLIEQGREEGTIEKEEQAMVDRIFQLGDETAYSLMTPRTQIVWLDLNDSIEHNLKILNENPNERIPVGNGSLDDCRGILFIKDYFNATVNKKIEEIEINELLKKPIYVPRTMEAFRLLEKFRNTGIHEAMVLDEYGGVVGFITLSDLMREIIGSDSNTDTESTQLTMIGQNSWFVDGLYDIDDFKKKFDIEELPEEDHDHYQTMGGFLTSFFGHIPNVGENFEWNGLRFEVIGMDRARIDKIHITRIE